MTFLRAGGPRPSLSLHSLNSHKHLTGTLSFTRNLPNEWTQCSSVSYATFRTSHGDWHSRTESRVQGRDTEDAPEMDWVWLQVCETFTLIVWDISLTLFGGGAYFFPSVNSR